MAPVLNPTVPIATLQRVSLEGKITLSIFISRKDTQIKNKGAAVAHKGTFAVVMAGQCVCAGRKISVLKFLPSHDKDQFGNEVAVKSSH